jgi:hypothetical protein
VSYTPGPFDSAHIYVQWGGKLPGGEGWSCGLRMRKKTSGAVDDGTGLLTGVSAAIATYHSSAQLNLSGLALLSFVKVNAINTAGHYQGSGTAQALFGDLPGGASNSAKYPNQVCCAISLTTGFSRGPAHRGRFYVPLPYADVQNDGRIADATANNMSVATDTLLSNLNAVNADYEVAIFSRKAGAAGNRKVTGNVVGRVLDTQRRRRRSLAEAWV